MMAERVPKLPQRASRLPWYFCIITTSHETKGKPLMPENAPQVVPLAVAAKWLGVSRATAHRMAEAGDFPGLVERTRRSGATRRWLVSRVLFEREVHGKTA
jgi:hypothetical protein